MLALLLDDRADIQAIIRHCLVNKLAWQLLTANSFKAGLELADANQPDVFLVSAALLSQESTTQEFQLLKLKSATNIPVVLLADRVRLFDQRWLQELGIAAVIAQPFDPLQLSKQIAAIANQQSASPSD